MKLAAKRNCIWSLYSYLWFTHFHYSTNSRYSLIKWENVSNKRSCADLTNLLVLKVFYELVEQNLCLEKNLSLSHIICELAFSLKTNSCMRGYQRLFVTVSGIVPLQNVGKYSSSNKHFSKLM